MKMFPPGSLLLCNKSVCGAKEGCTEKLLVMMTSWLVDFEKYPKNHVPTTCQEDEAKSAVSCAPIWVICFWCGREEMDAAMDQLQKKYNFRVTTSDEFKFCGRIIKQNEKDVYVTCPADVFISPQRRKQRGEMATNAEVSQLRSVVGSLSWYSRACRTWPSV